MLPFIFQVNDTIVDMNICKLIRHFRYLLFFGCILSIAVGQEDNALKIKQIKSDPNYVWGEGGAKKREEARSLAEENLLSKIQISIVVATKDEQSEKTTESGEIIAYEEFLSQHKSYSGLYLKGLDRIEIKQWRKWNVLAYVHKDSLAISFKIRKNKIREFVNTGFGAMEEGRIGEALRNFYWGYLLALVYPNTIHFGEFDLKISNYPNVAIANLIKTIFEDIDITTGECYQDGFAIMAPLQFSFRGLDITENYFSYYSGMGTDYAIVEDGIAEIPIYDNPSVSTRRLTLSIEYAYPNEMSSDLEILALYEVFKGNQFNNLKTVILHFPWLEEKDEKTKKEETDILTEMSTEVIDVLSRKHITSDFLETLQQYSKLGFIKYGRRSVFGNGNGCYVAIADQQNIVDILYYDGLLYKDIGSRKTYSDLSVNYKGKTQIWFKER